jgi:hypothetical protein
VSRRLRRGQGAVEYLIVLVFLVGFIVGVLVPSVRDGEVSVALASARSGALNYSANHADIRLLTLNYSVVAADQILLRPQVRNASSGVVLVPPAEMVASMVAAIQRLAPSGVANGSCAFLSNYDYCVVFP